VFVPNRYANGDVRELLEVLDDKLAPSQQVVVEIDVLPINDEPFFTLTTASLAALPGASGSNNVTAIVVESTISDIHDYAYGHALNVTYWINATDGNGGTWVMPSPSSSGVKAPCNISADGLNISCSTLIEKLNSWLKDGIFLIPNSNASSITIFMNVNDLGNIDKWNRPLATNKTLVIIFGSNAITVANGPNTSNTTLIAAAIAGLIAGALIAAVVFYLKRKNAKAAIDSYFDKFALGVDGASQTSPLYVPGTKGGENRIYKSAQDSSGGALT